ncbi:hypothetical protein ACFOWE_02840 [Planomonospora corallina]|uniref:HTH luxR-type domain-containing protein n=1 Tax=Planomonospora corallina TaxID=1806052 RepID=A0ABV8HZ61_9ACTN
MDVSVLGISAEAAEVYRYFLRCPGEGVGEARQALQLDQDKLERLIEDLAKLGLLDISDRHRVLATEPRVGIERLIEQRIDELNTEIRQVLAARDAIGSFVEDQKRGEDSEAALAIERVEGLAEVRRRIDDLAFFSYKHVLALHPASPTGLMVADYVEAARKTDMRSLRRGLTMRAVYHPSVLADPVFEAYLYETISLGAEVRVTDEPMDRMIIYDSVAVVAVDPKETTKGALFIREQGLVSQLHTYFSGVWQAAVDLREYQSPSSDTPDLTDLERRVLAVMASADKDEIAARELDVSVRTYRRYVADLMSRLGAVNRFQAALRAKEENWI